MTRHAMAASRIIVRMPAEIDFISAADVAAELTRAVDSGVSLSGGGRLGVPGLGPRGDVLVAVRPGAIAVTSQEPPDAGCATTWPARVTGLTLLAERVRLSLDGQPPALADVTPEAVAQLSLSPGCPVWLAVRPADLEVYPRPDNAAESVG